MNTTPSLRFPREVWKLLTLGDCLHLKKESSRLNCQASYTYFYNESRVAKCVGVKFTRSRRYPFTFTSAEPVLWQLY
jgi:hypothetical protein